MANQKAVAKIVGSSTMPSFSFKIDPSAITFQYNVNTHVDQTYGGQVVQILGAEITNLEVSAFAGSDGWDELWRITDYCRRLITAQTLRRLSVNFLYPPRNLDLRVFLTNLTIQDQVGNLTYPYRMQFEVDEDVNGVTTRRAITAELRRIQEGIGYEENQYNNPTIGEGETIRAGEEGSQFLERIGWGMGNGNEELTKEPGEESGDGTSEGDGTDMSDMSAEGSAKAKRN